MFPIIVLIAGFLLQAPNTPAPVPQKPVELNTAMMEATFKIFGPKAANPKERAVGTAFLMGRPVPGNPERLYFILVTAAHVLEDIQGEQAVLVVRGRTASNNYRRLEMPLRIRRGFLSLWTKHPTEDVAAMYVRLPENVASQPFPPDLLAVDADYERFEFHAGDEVLTVGYPNGAEANVFGFAILRSGRIASHPLTPVASVKTFLVDFSVFGGNSGGPVFINQDGRSFGGAYNMTKVFRVLGLVSQQMIMSATGERLSVAAVVHAAFIKETIALLPASP